MFRTDDVVQINSNHVVYGGLMFVVGSSEGGEMSGTFPGLSEGLVKLPESSVVRKVGVVEQPRELFLGVPGFDSSVSYTQRV